MIRCSTSSAQGRSGDIGPWSTLIGASIGTERRCAHGCRTPWYPHLLGITAPGAVCACPLAVQLDALRVRTAEGPQENITPLAAPRGTAVRVWHAVEARRTGRPRTRVPYPCHGNYLHSSLLDI